MNLKQIVATELKRIGADGLCNEDCGCSLNDFMPCNTPLPNCVPAKKKDVCQGGWIMEIKENK